MILKIQAQASSFVCHSSTSVLEDVKIVAESIESLNPCMKSGWNVENSSKIKKLKYIRGRYFSPHFILNWYFIEASDEYINILKWSIDVPREFYDLLAKNLFLVWVGHFPSTVFMNRRFISVLGAAVNVGGPRGGRAWSLCRRQSGKVWRWTRRKSGETRNVKVS